jgi:mannose-6-phosphate isomerase-like protein (cupin superfamily)
MTRPPIQLFRPRDLGPREWGTELLIAETPDYIGKILYMNAGKAGGLQAHAKKIETFYVYSGIVRVDYDPGDGKLSDLVLGPGMSVHIPVGATHRVTAITGAVLFECSTPVFDDRIRLEAEYGEPEAGGLPTTHPPSADATGQP